MTAVSPNTAFRNLQEEQQRLEAEFAASSHNLHGKDLEAAAEASKKKSNDALRRYFSALSGKDAYEARREQLDNVQPFSFEIRELTRPKSTNTLRAEQDKQKRIEEEEKHLKTRFKAHPVPPSTFVPKYQIMVDEWCARKEAVKVVAEQRAKELKEASQVGKDFAKDWRKEQDKQHPRRASRNKSREEAWEEWKQKHCKQFKARPIPESTYIPNTLLEEEREASRNDRVKARADQLLYESHAPARMEESLAHRVRERANKIVESHDIKKLPEKERAHKQRNQLRHQNPNFTFQPEIHREVPRYNELWAQERLRSAVAKQKIREELRRSEAGANQIAQSELDGGFRALKEHAVMSDTHKYAKLEKAKRRFLEVTKGKITPEEELARRLGSGHDPKDIDPVVATILLEQSAEDIMHRKRGIDAALFDRPASTEPGARRPGATLDVPCQRPRTTHAHVVKAAYTYRNIVADEAKALEEEKLIKERARRNKEVYERLLRAGLVEKKHEQKIKRPHSASAASNAARLESSSSIIDWDSKLADRKKAQKEETREMRKKLSELKQKVKNQPPIFVAEQQATYAFADLTKARADAEANIMSAWKQAGLDDAAAQRMMRTSGNNNKENNSVDDGNKNNKHSSSSPAAAAAAADTVVSPMSQPSGRQNAGGIIVNNNNEGKKSKKNADEEFETSSSSSDGKSSSSSSSSPGSSSSSSSGSSSSSK